MTGMPLVETLMWVGVFLAICGVAGLLTMACCTRKLQRFRYINTAIRLGLNRSIARNQAALYVSVSGMLIVVLGLSLR